jgi:hypothetical protein
LTETLHPKAGARKRAEIWKAAWEEKLPSAHTKETLKACGFQGLFAIFAVFSTNFLPNP